MPVVQTQNRLYEWVKLCEESDGKDSSYLQRDIICKPIVKLLPKMNAEGWQYELSRHGLFDPKEWSNLKQIVMELEKQNVWEIVKQEYKFLRKLWNGPKVTIYIFPIKKGNALGRQLPKKNGVAYKGILFLFVSNNLSIEEIKALFAHEYNHTCRLEYLNITPDKIPLKDSLIIEGLGEYAVKDLYGKKWLGPWVELYTVDDVMQLWKKHFVPSLNIEGHKNHQLFLYGNERGRFPKWIGYFIGFHIVDTYAKNHGPFTKNELYTKSSDEILTGSAFQV